MDRYYYTHRVTLTLDFSYWHGKEPLHPAVIEAEIKGRLDTRENGKDDTTLVRIDVEQPTATKTP